MKKIVAVLLAAMIMVSALMCGFAGSANAYAATASGTDIVDEEPLPVKEAAPVEEAAPVDEAAPVEEAAPDEEVAYEDEDIIDAEAVEAAAQAAAEGAAQAIEVAAEIVISDSDADVSDADLMPSIDTEQPEMLEGTATSGTLGTCSWYITGGKLIIQPADGVSGTLGTFNSAPWYANSNITSIEVKPGVIANADSRNLFDYLYKCTTMDLSNLDTSNATSFKGMFNECRALTSLDLSSWDTSNLTNMESLFYNCNAITSINLSGWDTSKVTNMSQTFYGCKLLTSLDVSHFDTSNVTTMYRMFSGCSVLPTIDVSHFDTSNVTNMSNLFNGCSKVSTLNVSGFDTSKVTSMSYMFASCSNVRSLDVSHFVTNNVYNMDDLFAKCGARSLDLSNWNTAKVTSMAEMFFCVNIDTLDLSSFDTSNVRYMNRMFYNCNIRDLNVTSFNTEKVTTMSEMFYKWGYYNLDLSSFRTPNVTSFYYMFYWSPNIKTLDIRNFDTSSATNMSNMFKNCSGISYLDLSGFCNDKVTTMEEMLAGCSSLNTIVISPKWKTAKTTTNMFSSCNSFAVALNGDDVTVTYTPKSTVRVKSVTVHNGGEDTAVVLPENPTNYTFSGYDADTKITMVFGLPIVTYDCNGGAFSSGVTRSPSTTNQYFHTYTTVKPIREGYVFEGWTIEPDGEEMFTSSTTVYYDMDVYALWAPSICNVTFDSKGGTEIDGQTVTYGAKAERPADPEKLGCDFKGWLKGDEAFDFNTAIKNHTTLTADWEIKTFTVTFKDDEGGEDEVVVEYGSTVDKPDDPEKEGYHVGGWEDEDGDDYDFTKPVTADKELHPRWVPNKYVVSFDAGFDGADAIGGKTVTYDAPYGELPEISRKGYDFDGWYFDPQSSGVSDSDIPVLHASAPITETTIVKTAADHTLYAHWTVKPAVLGDEDSSPRTGDNANTALLISVMLMSLVTMGGAAGAMVIKKRKCHK